MTSLSELFDRSIEYAGVAFGANSPAQSAARLTDLGRSYFAPTATAPAIGVIMANDRPSVEVLFGGIASSSCVVSLPPPARGADLGRYAQMVRAATETTQVAEIGRASCRERVSCCV